MSFWKSNAGKVSLVVVLLAAAGFFAWKNLSGGELRRPDTIDFVCVTTGKVFHLPRDGKARPIPCENPETKSITLVPCMERDGAVYVASRYRGTLRDMKDVNKAVDVETLKVTPVQ